MRLIENFINTQRLKSFIKKRYPIGTVINDPRHAQPYQIKETSIFEPVIEDISVNLKPFTFNGNLSFVDFYVRDTIKSPRYFVKTIRKDFCLQNIW